MSGNLFEAGGIPVLTQECLEKVQNFLLSLRQRHSSASLLVPKIVRKLVYPKIYRKSKPHVCVGSNSRRQTRGDRTPAAARDRAAKPGRRPNTGAAVRSRVTRGEERRTHCRV